MSLRKPIGLRFWSTSLFLRHELTKCVTAHKRFLSSTTLRTTAPAATASPSTPSTTPPPTKKSRPSPPPPPSQPSQPSSKSNEPPLLAPLSRPLGLTQVPKPGQNSGIDPRTWRQRRDDFFDYDKHLARRASLTQKISKPYFRDWTNLRHHKGKLFLAPQRLLRADKALFFPNLRGTTLAEPRDEQDTTNVLRGKVSVVRVFTGRWAERQVDTWTEQGKEAEGLGKLFKHGSGIVQGVNVNVEEGRMRLGIVRLFVGWQRRLVSKDMHDKCFLVTRGLSERIKQALGMGNQQVGYVFLVDGNCRIRWAGNAEAEDEERASMLRCVVKLVQEMKKLQDAGEGAKNVNERQRLSTLVARLPDILR